MSSWRKPQRSPIALKQRRARRRADQRLDDRLLETLVEELPVRRLVGVRVGRVLGGPAPAPVTYIARSGLNGSMSMSPIQPRPIGSDLCQ